MKTRNHKKRRFARLEILEDRQMMSADLGLDFSQARAAADGLACCGRAEVAVYAGSMETGAAHHAVDRTTSRSIVETQKASDSPRTGGLVGLGGVGLAADRASEGAKQAHEAAMVGFTANRLEHLGSGGIFSLVERTPALPTFQGAHRAAQALSVSAEARAVASEGVRNSVPARGDLASEVRVRQAMSAAEPASEHTPLSLAAAPTDGAGDVWSWVKNAASAVGETAKKVGEVAGQVVKTGWAIVKKAPAVNAIVSGVTRVQESARFSNAPKIDVSSLRPGDVLVFKGDGAMRSVIKYGTESGFNHSAIYVGNGMVIDAVGDGVVKRSLQDALSDQNFAGVLRREGLSEVQRQAIVSTAETWIGAKYSYKNCLKTGMGFIAISGGVRPAVTCSELVQKVYQEALSYRIADRDYPSPGDLAMASGLKAVGRLKDEPSKIAIRGPLGIPFPLPSVGGMRPV